MVLSMERWKGKVAIITGASSGIGAAICEKLVEAGLKVVGLARRKVSGHELTHKFHGKLGEYFPVQCDISVEEDILSTFKWVTDELGPIHILVNSAGVYKQRDLTEVPTEDFREVINTNVIALTVATREAVKNMLENKIDGHIIHIGSICGHGVQYSGAGVHCASKHAVKALTEGLRLDLNARKSRIKISSVSPGAVDTEILANVPDEIILAVPKLKSKNIAEAVVYVLSTPLGVQVHDLIIKPTGESW